MGDRRMLAQGREAEVYLQSDGTVLKLWRDPAWVWRLDREVAALNALADGAIHAPSVLGTVVVDDRPGLVTERVEGVDLLARLGRRPLSVFKAGRSLGLVHAAMHDVLAPHSLPDLNDDLRHRIREAAILPEDLRVEAIAILDRLPQGDRLCHGDFHPGNVMGTWSIPVVIDWGDASRGDPVADVARTYILQRMGVPPPGSPGLIRVLAPVGGRILTDRYLSAYRSRRAVDSDHLEAWKFVRAAARLFEPVPDEHPKLIRFLRERSGR